MKRVCVVIPMYGKEEFTRKCLELTLENAGYPIDVLIVDDGSLKPFEMESPCRQNIQVLRIEENSGFTNAANQGILWAQRRAYDYVHMLNNDTEPCPDFIKILVDIMEADSTVGIAGSVRQYPDGRVELCGADLIRGHQYFAAENYDEKPLEVNWLPICSALIRMDMIREIGILDKRFRNHCSDSWYCIHAKMNGWKVILAPKSKVIHYLSVTTTASGISAEKDQNLFIEKLACMDYAKLMKQMPLDLESKTYGQLSFTVYKK